MPIYGYAPFPPFPGHEEKLYKCSVCGQKTTLAKAYEAGQGMSLILCSEKCSDAWYDMDKDDHREEQVYRVWMWAHGFDPDKEICYKANLKLSDCKCFACAWRWAMIEKH